MTLTEPDRTKLEGSRGLVQTSRAYGVSDVEVRAQDQSTIVEFHGHASTWEPYDMYGGPDKGGWTETVAPGAFARTLKANADVPFLINHQGMSLARTKAGTLQLAEDSVGLEVRAQLDTRNTQVNDLVVEMERRSIDEMSFAFRVRQQTWTNVDGEEVPWWDLSGVNRTLNELDIHKGDVSVVNYGANDTTDASLRALMARVSEENPDEAKELRRLTLIAALAEKRAGMTLSSATMAVLQSVLDLITDADDNLDDALEQLSDLMGVPNPDEPEGPAEPPEDEPMLSFHPDLVAAQHRATALHASWRAVVL